LFGKESEEHIGSLISDPIERRFKNREFFENAHIILHGFATIILEGNELLQDVWDENSPTDLDVPYEIFVSWWEEKGITSKQIEAVFSILNPSSEGTCPTKVTYSMFIRSVQIFSKWWIGTMKKALMDLTDEKYEHFKTFTAVKANDYLQKNHSLRYIVRPRSKGVTIKRNGYTVLSPFAITVWLPDNTVMNHIISVRVEKSTQEFFYENVNNGEKIKVGSGSITDLCEEIVRRKHGENLPMN